MEDPRGSVIITEVVLEGVGVVMEWFAATMVGVVVGVVRWFATLEVGGVVVVGLRSLLVELSGS